MSRLQIPALQSSSPDLCDKLARRWRAGFFEEIHARFAAGVEGEEDIDVTHRRILDRLLDNDVGEGFAMVGPGLGDREREGLVRGWHEQVGMYVSSNHGCSMMLKGRRLRWRGEGRHSFL